MRNVCDRCHVCLNAVNVSFHRRGTRPAPSSTDTSDRWRACWRRCAAGPGGGHGRDRGSDPAGPGQPHDGRRVPFRACLGASVGYL
jgi:hypothetical protein